MGKSTIICHFQQLCQFTRVNYIPLINQLDKHGLCFSKLDDPNYEPILMFCAEAGPFLVDLQPSTDRGPTKINRWRLPTILRFAPKITIWLFNIAMENGPQKQMVYLLKRLIFHGYVSHNQRWSKKYSHHSQKRLSILSEHGGTLYRWMVYFRDNPTGWGPHDSVQLVYKWFNNCLWQIQLQLMGVSLWFINQLITGGAHPVSKWMIFGGTPMTQETSNISTNIHKTMERSTIVNG